MSRYRVYYMRPEYFPHFISGMKEPTLANLHDTNIYLCDVEVERPEQVFSAMQGESWSPEGEARALIEYRGLAHTSMSVGDVFEDTDTGIYYYLKMAGLGQLNDAPNRAKVITPNRALVIFDLPPYPPC